MTTLRRLSYAALGVAYLHLVFGAIVRITGSGMGCGDHWPKCYGRWFPPLERTDLIIEVTHRYLAAFLILTVVGLVVAAFLRRREPGVGGRGGVLRAATGAAISVIATALVGAVTVIFGNPAWATVFHWTLAMSLIALLAVAAMRAGGLGAGALPPGGASGKTLRGATIAAALALAAVVMGGYTAKVPGGSVACLSFPLCGANPEVATSSVHVQLTHRVLAFLLFFHFIGVAIGVRKRRESTVVTRAAWLAFGSVVLQLLVAGAMIGMKLPAPLRSLHEAVGVLVWLSSFALAYLARLATRGAATDGIGAPASPRTERGALAGAGR